MARQCRFCAPWQGEPDPLTPRSQSPLPARVDVRSATAEKARSYDSHPIWPTTLSLSDANTVRIALPPVIRIRCNPSDAVDDTGSA